MKALKVFLGAFIFTMVLGCSNDENSDDNNNNSQQVVDCNGVAGGTAYLDNCNECVGGNTGKVACVEDCNGDFGGTAYMAECNVCVGGNTGKTEAEECLEYKEVYNPTTGKIWLDRNLGASRVAQSSTDSDAYGYLYQWGRGTDGHEIRTSSTSTSYTVDPDKFTLSSSSQANWMYPPSDDLWQGVNGINNPCPSGYRVPTSAELEAERLTWINNKISGAFASPLKFTVAGERSHYDGAIQSEGLGGFYWSCSINFPFPEALLIVSTSSSRLITSAKSTGKSVRCIKD